MNCPHCAAKCTSIVLETRKDEVDVYRRRACGMCGKSVVTREYADASLKMPPTTRDRKHTGRGNIEGVKATNLDAFKAWR